MASTDELASLLAVRRGHFRLESGHHGDIWLDLDRLFVRPAAAQRLAAKLAERLARYGAAAVCGPLVGGALVAQMIATELDVEFYYTERIVRTPYDALYPVDYRLPASFGQPVRGKAIAVIDDAINAGSAVRGTLAELRAQGGRPAVVGALIVLGTAGPGFLAEQQLPLESLAHLPSGLWEPAACPLCAARVPLEERQP